MGYKGSYSSSQGLLQRTQSLSDTSYVVRSSLCFATSERMEPLKLQP
jgi:hypothetical protein